MTEKAVSTGDSRHDFRNASLSFEDRAKLLLTQMTLEEKCLQMTYDAPGIPRLDIAPHNWWNECLHGVGRAGVATVFPQAIALAATFDADLMNRVATAISDEARAKHHVHAARGDFGIYKGLTYWTPNINIFRDPRWGRGHETYGECPYLTARLGVAFCKGMQGDDPRYLKLVATPKHFAVHSGPELGRHSFDSKVGRKDLFETYLPAFRACVVEAKAFSVMGAYNRLNGVPCCADDFLLNEVLRKTWGFTGYTVSDCGAVADIHAHHKYTPTPAASAAAAVHNGLDLCCGNDFAHLADALAEGLLSEADIDRSVLRLMEARLRLGMFDPPERVPYVQIPYEVVDSAEHRALSLEAARASIVLLKNDRNILPLSDKVKTIAVIGPNADARQALLGNYAGTPSYVVSPLDAIRTKSPKGTRILFAPGCDHLGVAHGWLGTSDRGFVEAVIAAETSDAVVLCLGLNTTIEGEEGDSFNSDSGGDRRRIEIPTIQQQLLERIVAVGKPVILVVISGSAIALGWAHEHATAVIQQFYPGQDGGTALAEVLFGEHNPSGRLPVTFYSATTDLPPFEDYSMIGRTYRYFDGRVVYPFGFGLSYSQFEYSELQVPNAPTRTGDTVTVGAKMQNVSDRAGTEVVQLYLQHLKPALRNPIRQLAGIQHVLLKAGETRAVEFSLGPEQLAIVEENGTLAIHPGRIQLSIGGSQPDSRSIELNAARPISREIELSGSRMVIR